MHGTTILLYRRGEERIYLIDLFTRIHTQTNIYISYSIGYILYMRVCFESEILQRQGTDGRISAQDNWE